MCVLCVHVCVVCVCEGVEVGEEKERVFLFKRVTEDALKLIHSLFWSVCCV